MAVRPSMLNDLRHCGFSKGLFLYSLWEGYRDSDYQRKFEEFLQQSGFRQKSIHTSGHASIEDIKRVIDGLKPKRVIPIHTLNPELFEGLSSEVELHDDGVGFEI